MVENKPEMDYIDAYDIDVESIRSQNNMVRLDDEVAIRIACMDAATPGSTSKRSIVNEAVEKYYSAYFAKMDGESIDYEDA